MSYIFLGPKNSEMRCELSFDLDTFFPKNEFPFKFQVLSLQDQNIRFEVEIYPGMWASFPQFRDLNSKLLTKNGKLIKEYNYSYEDENLKLYEFWEYFAKFNPDSVGLILGSGDGLWGEWVNPIHKNGIKCHLIEGSNLIFDKLKKNYREKDNFSLHNIIISPKGEKCIFYDMGSDGDSSLNPDYLKKLSPNFSFDSIRETSTVSLNDFLSQFNEINWIRCDLEGIDSDLILSLNPLNLDKIKMIQYEHLFLEEEKIKEVDLFMNLQGFNKKIVFEIDTIYLKENI